jgi:hypothetical protein
MPLDKLAGDAGGFGRWNGMQQNTNYTVYLSSHVLS